MSWPRVESCSRKPVRCFVIRRGTRSTFISITREGMRQNPPQIMLTNYVMAELMLVRPEDQRFLDRVGGGLRFLVLDELHTYIPGEAGC
jgi:ATP-dependent helicase YprA (DUF1998 family)